MDNKVRTAEIIKRLKKTCPEPVTPLYYKTPFELLAATILSAQTTDAHVNKVTSSLFRKYRTIRDYAEVPIETLRKDLSSINFFNNKARNIQASAIILIEKFNSRVPGTMEELVTLPGVARKTANIVLSNVYGINEGIAVDTHVKRLSFRLGLTQHTDPVKIEKDLMAMTPRENWSILSNLLIFQGRRVCKARKPNHTECVLYDICPSKDI